MEHTLNGIHFNESRQHLLSFVERYVPKDTIMTLKGRSSIRSVSVYNPEQHPTSLILPHLFRVDILCFNGCMRSFGFRSVVIDENKRVKVSGYSEMFEEVKGWELAK